MTVPLLSDPILITMLALSVGILPLLGKYEHRRLQRWIEARRSDARLRHYAWTEGSEWILTVPLFVWWVMEARGLGEGALRLSHVPSGWEWLGVAAAIGASLFLFFQMRATLENADVLDKLRSGMGELIDWMPRTHEEHQAFSRLSVTAGICEEVLYRGILLASLEPFVGPWVAALASSVLFGMGHAYQGVVGVAKTAGVGLVLAAITLLSGSLVPAILLHAVLDLTSGRILGAAAALEDRQRSRTSLPVEAESPARTS